MDGNHENFDLLRACPEQKWHGGRVHQVRPHVLHLMRGQVFEIGGFTWFTMGGAASHDIEDGILDPAAPDFEQQYRTFRRMGKPDRLTDFLETVRQQCQFSQWFCGHYHINQVIDGRFVIQWEQISRIDCN